MSAADVHGDAALEYLIDPDPRARQVPGISRVVEPPIVGPLNITGPRPTTGPRVQVRRSPDLGAERPWRAQLVTPPGDVLGDVAVGRFDSMLEAVRTGVTAARFVAAGIPWRAEQ